MYVGRVCQEIVSGMGNFWSCSQPAVSQVYSFATGWAQPIGAAVAPWAAWGAYQAPWLPRVWGW